MNKTIVAFCVTFGIGLILISLSLVSFVYVPSLIKSQIFKTLDINDKKSQAYKNFVSRKIYAFLIIIKLFMAISGCCNICKFFFVVSTDLSARPSIYQFCDVPCEQSNRYHKRLKAKYIRDWPFRVQGV